LISLLSRSALALTLVFMCLARPARADFFPPQKLADVVVTGDPVAPSPSMLGTGLCTAERKSADPNFPQESSAFIATVNQLLDTRTEQERLAYPDYVLDTPFDLSNNLNDGRTLSYGDFVNVVSGCSTGGIGGCNFRIIPVGDSSTYFGSRFRGYLNVRPEMVGRPLHFGIYADQAVTFIIYDRNNVTYPIIKRPTSVAAVTWRTTNSVTFRKAGLYPVEILYAQIIEHAALELSILDKTFSDFERAANDPPVINLKDDSSAGFTLVSPEMFFQTETGRPSFPNPDQCLQCNRANANNPGNGGAIEQGGCGINSGYYCNGAALCAPCDTSRVCGPSCSPCGQSTPNCVNVNGTYACVECTDDTQCGGRKCDLTTNTCKGCLEDRACGAGQVCDKLNYTCVECNRDEDCPPDEVCAPEIKQCRECNQNSDCERGKSCQEHQCVTCSANEYGLAPSGTARKFAPSSPTRSASTGRHSTMYSVS